MENPYQSPEEPVGPLVECVREDLSRHARGLVHHVRVLAILMVVQGVLELMVGIGIGAMAMVLPQMMQADFRQTLDSPELPPNFFWFMSAVYGGAAAAALTAAVLHIVAGVLNFRFRGRVLAIVALAGGMLSFFTCYCLPTAVGLGVYGLIVYLNDSVVAAFRMGRSGYSASQILAVFRDDS